MSPDDRFDERVRASAPPVPEGLAGRVLERVREEVLAKLRFREDLEQSARASLIAAAAGFFVCAALFVGERRVETRQEAKAPNAPSARLDAPSPEAARVRTQGPLTRTQGELARTQGEDPVEQLSSAEALTLSAAPGALEGELTSDFWFFGDGEGE